MNPQQRDVVGPVLVTGPARSGKSEWAEHLAAASGLEVVYIATAREDPLDTEWTARIARHRQRRPVDWQTLCAPFELAGTLAGQDLPGRCLLIDSLGTWVANLLDEPEPVWRERMDGLLAALQTCRGLAICVAEETGWGVIPAYPSGRLFRDRLGTLVRRLGPSCAACYLVAGGHALDLRRFGTPLPASG